MNANLRSTKKALLYALFFVNLACILFLWWHGSGDLFGTTAGLLIALGRIAGLLVEYLILVQLILIGRVRPVERMYGHDVLNYFHRMLGKIIACVLLLHPVLLIVGYAKLNNVGLITQFFTFINNWEDVFKALIAFCILNAIVVISLVIIRKRLRYETWYGIHLFIYLAIFLAFGHQTNTADVSFGSSMYYWFTLNFTVFGLVLLYRFIRPFYLFFKHRFYIEKVVQESPDIYSIYIRGKNLETFRYESGQFANLIILSKKMFFGHPFSFSTAPNGKFLRFSIKSSGNYTNKIKDIIPGTYVVLDGPLGAFTEDFAITKKFLLVAGGIGITPVRALAESLSTKKRDVILMYSFRNEKDAALALELAEFPMQKYFIESEKKGRITVQKIQKFVPDFKERDIYVCGPHAMIEELVEALRTAGVQKQRIHYEEFAY